MPDLTPTHYRTLVSSPNTDQLVRLNAHLRTQKIDARFCSHSPVGPVIKVPPEQHARAGKLRDAWLGTDSDVLSDERAVRQEQR